jgi:hypothetical protein
MLIVIEDWGKRRKKSKEKGPPHPQNGIILYRRRDLKCGRES